jgi:hypothetical protein
MWKEVVYFRVLLWHLCGNRRAETVNDDGDVEEKVNDR